MNKEMIISSGDHDTRVAILEDDQVVEVFIERENQRGVVGNIYKGRVSKVLPGMQSSFVDIGLERDAFLYVSEVVNTVEEFERPRAGVTTRTTNRRCRRSPVEPVTAAAEGAADPPSPREPQRFSECAGRVGERRRGRARAASARRSRARDRPEAKIEDLLKGRAGHPRPGRQGAARHQGRAPDLARHDAGPLPGVHADGRPRRRLAQDRIARRARPPARHRPRVPRAARLHRRRHHPDRRVRPLRRKTSSATSPGSTRSGPRSARRWRRAARRRCSSRSRASSPSCCAIC